MHYLDGDSFRMRYPQAHDAWSTAFDLYVADAVRHATRIGHDCRESLAAFASQLASDRRVALEAGAGSVTKIGAVIDSMRGPSKRHSAVPKSSLPNWHAVSDLAQRQEHGAAREREKLLAEDGRRIVFMTMVVMHEVDRALNQTRLACSPASY